MKEELMQIIQNLDEHYIGIVLGFVKRLIGVSG